MDRLPSRTVRSGFLWRTLAASRHATRCEAAGVRRMACGFLAGCRGAEPGGRTKQLLPMSGPELGA